MIDCINSKTECEINGIRQEYDACSTESLEKAKAFYTANFYYIGSGKGVWIDGILNWPNETHHFFKKRRK